MNKTFEKFFGQPHHMLPTSWEAKSMQLAQAELPSRDPKEPLSLRPEVDAFGDPMPKMEMVGSVAIVPVFGQMLKGATPFDKWAFGFVAHEDIAADLLMAQKSGAKSILMVMNSPGGSARGTPELADLVARIVKQGTDVFDFSSDLKCSAAEYITGACTARFATPSSTLGAIGTMLETVSYEKLLDRIGIQYNIFASGKFKAMGHPAKTLTEEQAAFLQDFVAQRSAEFQEHMASYRPNVDFAAMQGQMLTGTDALNAGLIDQLVSGLPEVLDLIG